MQQDYSKQVRVEKALFDLGCCITELSHLQPVISKQDIDYLQLLNQQIRQIFSGGNNGIA